MRRAVLLLLLAAAGPQSGGTIAGSVVVVNGHTTVKRDDVYVYLVELHPARRHGPLPGAGQKFAIHQKGMDFVPHVLVVPRGADVAFPNDDKDTHNVFSPTDPTFDLGRYGPDRTGHVQRFLDADEFDIYCDMHRQMWAKVKVVDSARIEHVKDGAFTFAGVPDGEYKVVAWVRSSPEVSQVVRVTGGKPSAAVELHLQLAHRSGCHDRKDGSVYPSRYSACPPDD